MQISDAAAGMHLFRIVQEALNNAIKHSHAKRIQVRLREMPDAILVCVSDDGQGFETAQVAGMGRRTMRYRADAIGATLEVVSERGKGTTVSCTMPLRTAAPAAVAAVF
jgi:signal transduction histidine kinase